MHHYIVPTLNTQFSGHLCKSNCVVRKLDLILPFIHHAYSRLSNIRDLLVLVP